MSFLVSIINDAIQEIDKHLQRKLTTKQDQIPEAFLAQKIAKVKLDPGMLAYDRTAEQQVADEVDKLALYLKELKLGMSKQAFLSQKLKFGDITWQQLMDKEYAAETGFASDLINNLDTLGVGFQKLIILARLKHRLLNHVEQASRYLIGREELLETSKPAQALESHEREDKRSKQKRKHKQEQGGASKEVEQDEGVEQAPFLPECIDEWLWDKAVEEIKQAQVMSEKAETGEFRASHPGEFSGGETKPLLAKWLLYTNTMYEFLKNFDEHEDVRRAPQDKYALRDFLPSYYQDHHPVTLAYRQSMQYVKENIKRDAEVMSQDQRSWQSYLSIKGLGELASYGMKTASYDFQMSFNKREQVARFFRVLSGLVDKDNTRVRVLEQTDLFWNSSAGLSGSRAMVFSQNLVANYEHLHKQLETDATHSEKAVHAKVCTHT